MEEETAYRPGAFLGQLLALLVLLVLPVSAAGAEPHVVPKAAAAIKVDGVHDEDAWDQALRLELPFETHPGDNIPARVRTELRLTYDDTNLYAAFTAWDEDPGAVRAHLSDRDGAFSDDFVGIVLDTFNDERRAFEFFVNPLGVQMDLIQDDVSGNEDSSWDTIWDSAGRLNGKGYQVELAIPFASLRFPRSDGELTFGLDAVRIYPRDQRYRLGLNVIDRDIGCYLCQSSKIRGFAGVRPGKNLELVPVLVASGTQEREAPEDDFSSDSTVDPGLNATYSLTSELVMTFAGNPDFSQVEADVAQLAVNNRFTLFFPERRPFFLEGADTFDTPFSAVFTRTVADPSVGVKLTGKQGRHAVGALFARDEVNNLVFPGPQGSDSTSLDEGVYSGILRYRHDVGEASAVGVLFTGRGGEDYHNRLVGVDALFRPRPSDTLRIQYLRSGTRYPDDVAEEFEQPTGSFGGHAFKAHYDNGTRNWGWWGLYEDIGPGFRADSGFMPQTDKRFALAGLNRRWWADSDDTWWSKIQLGGDLDYAVDRDGNLLEREAEFWLDINGPMQSYLGAGAGLRDRVFDDTEFNGELFEWFWFEMRPSSELLLELGGRFGDEIDFANARPATQFELEPGFELNFNRHLKLSLFHTYQRLTVEGGRLFTANLSRLRLVYQFSVRTFVRGIVQFQQVDRNQDLYIDDVDARTRDLFTQFLFSYKINPRTVLFLGYSDSHEADDLVDLTQRARTVFFKVSYAWRL